MPAGLTRTSLPLEVRVPRMALGSAPVTRLMLVLAADGCSKRVTEPAGTEKLCQLSALWLRPAPLLVVMVRFLPLALTLAAPCRTCRPVGCASAAPALMKALARARVRRVSACPLCTGPGA